MRFSARRLPSVLEPPPVGASRNSVFRNGRAGGREPVRFFGRLSVLAVIGGAAVAFAVVWFIVTGPFGKTATIPEPLHIEVTGDNYEWSVRYPGQDGALGTSDDFTVRRNLNLAAGVATKITLKSKDYLYGFELPDFGLMEIAVPDLTFSLEFTPAKAGTYPGTRPPDVQLHPL